MARPTGQFQEQCSKLFSTVKDLVRKRGYCFASNGFLSKVMRVGEKQIERYLISLQKEKKIQVHIKRYSKDGFWKTERKILVRDPKSPWAKPYYPNLKVAIISVIKKEVKKMENTKKNQEEEDKQFKQDLKHAEQYFRDFFQKAEQKDQEKSDKLKGVRWRWYRDINGVLKQVIY